MKMETKKTLTLTKAEKEVLVDFYWNCYDNDADNDIYEILKALNHDQTEINDYKIEIID